MKKKAELLYYIPYSISSMKSAPSIRAHNLNQQFQALIPDERYHFLNGYNTKFMKDPNTTRVLLVEAFATKLPKLKRIQLKAIQADLKIAFVRDIRWLFPDLQTNQQEKDDQYWNKINSEEAEFYIKNGFRFCYPSEGYHLHFEKHYGLSGGRFECYFPPGAVTMDRRGDSLPEVPVVSYIGGASERRGIPMLIDAVGKARKKGGAAADLRCNIITPMHFIGNIKQVSGNPDFLTIKEVNFSTLPAVYRDSYILALPFMKDTLHDFMLPMKIFEYMASGRPVLCTNLEFLSSIIKKHNCGLIAEATVDALSDAIFELVSNRKKAEELGKNGFDAFLNGYTWKHRAVDFLKHLEASHDLDMGIKTT